MRVLVAADGSESSARSLELAGSIHWPPQTEIRVATVIEPLEPALYGAWLDEHGEPDNYAHAAEEMAQAIVENAKKVLAPTSARITPCTLHGRPASEIVAEAEQFRADLIIVGSRGHGAIASALLGSVSAEISDRAPCPVLVARSSRLTRAVLAVDGSEFARAAEDLVARWPIFDQVAIEVTNVTDSMPVASALALGHYPPIPDGAEVRAAAVHKRIVHEAAGRLAAAHRSVVAVLEFGAPAYELMRTAADHQAELIVVGTHGRTGVQRALLGSVARNVLLRAKCSVLIVRPIHGEALGAAA